MLSDLSVIVVEFHCQDQVVRLYDSLMVSNTERPGEFIVVSNSLYNEDQLSSLSVRIPLAKIIRSDCNGGYAHGVNLGIEASSAEYLLVLNPDCTASGEDLGRLLETSRRDRSIGIVAPRLVHLNGEPQFSCRSFPKPWTFLLLRTFLKRLSISKSEANRYLLKSIDHTINQDVDWVSGAAMLVRKEYVKRVGKMDERYFLYMEDVDWCRRFWNGGLRVHYVGSVVVRHEAQHKSVSLSGGIFSSIRHLKYHLTSLARYTIKWAFVRPRINPRITIQNPSRSDEHSKKSAA